MMNSRIQLCVVATVAALGVTSAHASRVLPTVNKIDVQTGDASTISLYQGLSSAPNGITVAAGDIDGDGFGDFATLEHWGDPHENVNGVIVRGWDYTVKAQVSPPDMLTFPVRYAAIGNLTDGANTDSMMVLSSGSGSSSMSYHYYMWRRGQQGLPDGFSDVTTVQPFSPADGYDGSMSVAIDSLATDGYGLVVGTQESLDHNGHVTILKAQGDVGGSYQVSENTFGGGVRVATGDIDGDGRSEICTMSIGETMGATGPERCIDLSVIFVTGTPGPESFNYSKIEFEYKPQRKGDLDAGILPGGITCGDVDGDGLAELIFTTTEDDGPEARYLDFVDNGNNSNWDFGGEHEISLAGVQDDDVWNEFTILEPSFSSATFQNAPEGSPLGSLLFSTLVVPEPTTLAALGAIGMVALRRRA